MPRGQAELVTTFEVDANGLLKVSAQDRASGRKASISMYAPHHALLGIHCLQVSPTPLVASRRQKLIK
jgi:Hsp70 protein